MANYTLLEKITVGAAGASSVTFSSIPQTGYTDLVVKYSARGTNAVTGIEVAASFNGVTTNLSSKGLYGSGSGAGSQTLTTVPGLASAAADTANVFGSSEIYIPNYTGSTFKSSSTDAASENNGTTAYTYLTAGLWSATSAITQITLTCAAGNFVQYSTFYLYGVAKLGTTPAIVPYATGGDTIMTDGTYWYHTFLSSGTFTPQKAISCDYLVVAGGAGGGGGYGGGGGAGGLRSTVTATGGGGSLESALSLLSGTGYTVTVGAGGAGGAGGYNSANGSNGSNSVFSTITSTGGGGGGNARAGSSGGSGGGGSELAGGSGTANQGFAGTAGTVSNKYGAGGGGGAGTAATSAYTDQGGNGGSGVAVSITGSSVTYAGGGGGGTYQGGTAGTGGSGGGGNAGTPGVNTATGGFAATANSGSGGGGAAALQAGGLYTAAGGNGGSGIVIVRYAV